MDGDRPIKVNEEFSPVDLHSMPYSIRYDNKGRLWFKYEWDDQLLTMNYLQDLIEDAQDNLVALLNLRDLLKEYEWREHGREEETQSPVRGTTIQSEKDSVPTDAKKGI